jgi:hypothetical protein
MAESRLWTISSGEESGVGRGSFIPAFYHEPQIFSRPLGKAERTKTQIHIDEFETALSVKDSPMTELQVINHL